MEELCRLCAIPKQPEEFKCKIYDRNLNIEQKLITCCNWNSYRSNENLPENICMQCFLQLEQCWYFREAVSRAQRKLCDLIDNVESKKLHKRQKSYENPIEDIQMVEVKVESPEDDGVIEIGPIEVTGLKIDHDDENYTNDDDIYSANEFESDGYVPAANPLVEEKTKKTVLKPKTKPKTKKAKSKHSISNATLTNNLQKFETFISKHLSNKDINEDGTIKPEKIREQKFCNWIDLKHLCYQCDEEFNDHSILWQHFASAHSYEKLKYVCPICKNNTLFLSGRYYRDHIKKVHFPHLTYSCYKCQKFFYDKKKLGEHLRSHPKDPGQNVCGTCQKSFSYYKNLYVHLLSHLPIELQPQFECYLCKKSLKSNASLQKHMKFHLGVFKSAVCDQCGKAFATASKLKKHMVMHSEDRPFTCNSCFKKFKTSSVLRRHVRIHESFKAYVCDICGHRTLDKSALKLHIVRYHTDESPFPCEICGKQYYSLRTLKTHQKLHFEDRPFACNVCDHRTINLNALKRHHKHVHLGHNPHACNLCEYRTYSKHNLRLHVSRRHAPKAH